jgi:hypothetical protein
VGTGGTAERPLAAGQSTGKARASRSLADDRRTRVPSAADLAWLALLPCALVMVAAIVVLGPWAGRIALPHSDVAFFPYLVQTRHPAPEPTEHGRFLIALLAPLALATCVLLGTRRARPIRVATIGRLVLLAQTVALAFVATCVVVQQTHRFEIVVASQTDHTVYFTIATLLSAAAIAALIATGLRSSAACRGFRALARETPVRRVGAFVAALGATAVWLLPAINFEDTIGNANHVIAFHLPYWLDEAFAVLDGRRPLVDFAGQYSSLWSYPIAAAMAALGASIGVFTVASAAIGAGAMLATFATLRRVVRSSTVALLLFLPLLATSLFMMEGPLENRYAISNLFGTFPLRYAGPLLLAWLLARHLDGSAPRRMRWLFLAAGLVVLNNVEFGLPAFGATVAALLWSGGRWSHVALRRMALEAAIGLGGALVLVSALTLVLAGSLPHLRLLVSFSRVFAIGGWGMLPMTPLVGVSTVIYLTYVAAIGVATVRAVDGEPDRLMTAMLAFSGVFGLGIGSYYVGRSHPQVLTNMFAAWSLSVTLLLVVAVRAIAARPSRRPTLAEAGCLCAFGVLVCSLAQTPRPWAEVARLQRPAAPLYAHPAGEGFVAAHTKSGDTVAILAQLGHRAAYNLGLNDVTPSTWGGYVVTVEQLDEVLDRLRAAGGRAVFVSSQQMYPEVDDQLRRRGYVPVDEEAATVAYTAVR